MTRRLALIVAAVLLALGISGGVAYAYFDSTGTANATATVGTLQVVSGDAITTQTPDTLLQPGSVSMSSTSADGCQGATFDVPVSVAVHS